MNFGARGIIRGRWDIDDYEVNVPVAAVFDGGPEIEAARGAKVTRDGLITTKNFKFSGSVLDSIPPDVQSFASTDVAKLHDEVNSLVRAKSVERAQAFALSGSSISQFVHVNRVQGIALGGGLHFQEVGS